MRCKNCNTPLIGYYCSHCGQSARVDDISFKYIINEIPESVFQINHGLLYTIKELFIRPGHMIRGYLKGKRKDFFRPVGYVLLMSTFYAVVTLLDSGTTFIGEVMLGMTESDGDVFSKSSWFNNTLNWLAGNHAYATLLLLPLFALASHLAFKKFQLNYYEHFVINAYITGQQSIIYALFALLEYYLFSDSYYFPLIPITLSISLAIWTFIQFFQNGHKFNLFYAFIIYLSAILLTVDVTFDHCSYCRCFESINAH